MSYNSSMKKTIIIAILSVIVYAAIFKIVVPMKMIFSKIYDDKDTCLDVGWCKEGLPLQDGNTGEEFIINIDTCKAHNGEWREGYCFFKH